MAISKPNRKGVPVTIYISEETKQEIDRIASKRNIPSARVYRMMLDLGVSCHQDMEKVGIIAAVDFAYFVKKSVIDKIESKENRQLRLF